MRFYRNASNDKQANIENGVFLTKYSDGHTKEHFFIKFDGDVIYKSKGWEMPTNRTFTSSKGNTILFTEGKYIVNIKLPSLNKVTPTLLKEHYKEYLSLLDEELQYSHSCGFDELSRYEIRELIGEINKAIEAKAFKFEDNAFFFSDKTIFDKKKIIFTHKSTASGRNDDKDNVAIRWICEDGLLLNGETPSIEEIEAYEKKIKWASERGNGGMTGRYRG